MGLMAGLTTSDVDGRRARRDRNRDAVLDAVISLFSEDVEPTPDAVAQRCGLSPRSIYRYFEDREGLVQAAIDRAVEAAIPLLVIEPVGEGPLDQRVTTLVDSRLAAHQAVGATARAARRRVGRSEALARQVTAGRSALRDQVAAQFAPELGELPTPSRAARLGALDTLLQFESLDALISGVELDEHARATLVEACHALLRP
jgi:AcrR family transcriptional regulator